jgi:hypothetical protein
LVLAGEKRFSTAGRTLLPNDEQYRLAALEGMRDYIDRLSGEYKENAESLTLINHEQASNAQSRILPAKPLWSVPTRRGHRTDSPWRT